MPEKVLVGCSGWFYRAWRGLFYPEELPQSKWFFHYSSKFQTVEINSTFYHFPKKERVKRWFREAPEGFVYTVKVPRVITHLKKMKECGELLREFYETVSHLGDKLGAVLFQFPPSVKKDEGFLFLLSKNLPREFKNAVEFRHRSWFADEVRNRLEEEDIAFVEISAPDFGEITEKVTGPPGFAYVRMHGLKKWYDYDYTEEELRKLAEGIRECKSKEVYVYFNNDVGARAPANAAALIKILKMV